MSYRRDTDEVSNASSAFGSEMSFGGLGRLDRDADTSSSSESDNGHTSARLSVLNVQNLSLMQRASARGVSVRSASGAASDTSSVAGPGLGSFYYSSNLYPSNGLAQSSAYGSAGLLGADGTGSNDGSVRWGSAILGFQPMPSVLHRANTAATVGKEKPGGTTNVDAAANTTRGSDEASRKSTATKTVTAAPFTSIYTVVEALPDKAPRASRPNDTNGSHGLQTFAVSTPEVAHVTAAGHQPSAPPATSASLVSQSAPTQQPKTVTPRAPYDVALAAPSVSSSDSFSSDSSGPPAPTAPTQHPPTLPTEHRSFVFLKIDDTASTFDRTSVAMDESADASPRPATEELDVGEMRIDERDGSDVGSTLLYEKTREAVNKHEHETETAEHILKRREAELSAYLGKLKAAKLPCPYDPAWGSIILTFVQHPDVHEVVESLHVKPDSIQRAESPYWPHLQVRCDIDNARRRRKNEAEKYRVNVARTKHYLRLILSKGGVLPEHMRKQLPTVISKEYIEKLDYLPLTEPDLLRLFEMGRRYETDHDRFLRERDVRAGALERTSVEELEYFSDVKRVEVQNRLSAITRRAALERTASNTSLYNDDSIKAAALHQSGSGSVTSSALEWSVGVSMRSDQSSQGHAHSEHPLKTGSWGSYEGHSSATQDTRPPPPAPSPAGDADRHKAEVERIREEARRRRDERKETDTAAIHRMIAERNYYTSVGAREMLRQRRHSTSLSAAKGTAREKAEEPLPAALFYNDLEILYEQDRLLRLADLDEAREREAELLRRQDKQLEEQKRQQRIQTERQDPADDVARMEESLIGKERQRERVLPPPTPLAQQFLPPLPPDPVLVRTPRMAAGQPPALPSIPSLRLPEDDSTILPVPYVWENSLEALEGLSLPEPSADVTHQPQRAPAPPPPQPLRRQREMTVAELYEKWIYSSDPTPEAPPRQRRAPAKDQRHVRDIRSYDRSPHVRRAPSPAPPFTTLEGPPVPREVRAAESRQDAPLTLLPAPVPSPLPLPLPRSRPSAPRPHGGIEPVGMGMLGNTLPTTTLHGIIQNRERWLSVKAMQDCPSPVDTDLPHGGYPMLDPSFDTPEASPADLYASNTPAHVPRRRRQQARKPSLWRRLFCCGWGHAAADDVEDDPYSLYNI